jgi:hypothetical protein
VREKYRPQATAASGAADVSAGCPVEKSAGERLWLYPEQIKTVNGEPVHRSRRRTGIVGFY